MIESIVALKISLPTWRLGLTYATIGKAVAICRVAEQSAVRFADAQLMNVRVGGAAFGRNERSKIGDLNDRRVQLDPTTSCDELQMVSRIIDQIEIVLRFHAN